MEERNFISLHRNDNNRLSEGSLTNELGSPDVYPKMKKGMGKKKFISNKESQKSMKTSSTR
jgi:hypothetical protein